MVGREAKRIAARKWIICFGRAIPLKTSLKADKEVGGCLGAAFSFVFFDGIHATAGLAWVESWPLRFCRHHSVLLALGLGTDCSTAIILVERSVLPFCTHHLGRTDRSTATILVEPSVLPFINRPFW